MEWDKASGMESDMALDMALDMESEGACLYQLKRAPCGCRLVRPRHSPRLRRRRHRHRRPGRLPTKMHHKHSDI
jgi:hypothetical protein